MNTTRPTASARTPHIVLLSAFFSPFRSGAEAMVEEVTMRLSNNYRFTIVTSWLDRSLPREEERGNITIIRVGMGSGIDKWLYPFLAPMKTSQLKPDIIHAVLETFAGLALFFCRCTTPKILTLQTTNRKLFKGPIIRHADHVTAISNALVQIARRCGRFDATLIHNGVDLHGFVTAKHTHKKVPGRILFLGRLVPMKGIDTLIEGLSMLYDEDLLKTNATLHIVGDGQERYRLEALVKKLGLSARVVFLGKLTGDAVFKEFAEAEVFAGLSRSEALGNVFLEAQAAGCAVLATAVGGIPEIVKNEQTGILIPPNKPKLAAESLLRLFEDKNLRMRLSMAGEQNAKMYDWQMIADEYLKVYEGVGKAHG